MPSAEERDQIISVAPPDPERDRKLATLEGQIEKVKAGPAPADSLRGVRIEPEAFRELVLGEQALPSLPVPREKCCEKDTDGDGNCHLHVAPSMYRVGRAVGKSLVTPNTEAFRRASPLLDLWDIRRFHAAIATDQELAAQAEAANREIQNRREPDRRTPCGCGFCD